MEIIGMQLAVTVVTISIILSGIAIGIGRGFGYKRVEVFGVEELFQSVVNAAIVGAIAVIVEAIKSISASITSQACSTGDLISELGCSLEKLAGSAYVLMNETVTATNTIGYYQSMVLDFGSFSIQPFASLSNTVSILSSQALTLNFALMLINLNAQIVSFFAQNALALFLPIGLILRSFFATRRVGGFLIGIAIGLYVFYPAFIVAFPTPDLQGAITAVQTFNANPFYTTVPILDLNGNNAIAAKMDNMSASWRINNSNYTYTADFSGDITLIAQSNANAIAKILLYSVIAPIFAIIITIVFIKEMTSVLGGEIQFRTEVI